MKYCIKNSGLKLNPESFARADGQLNLVEFKASGCTQGTSQGVSKLLCSLGCDTAFP